MFWFAWEIERERLPLCQIIRAIYQFFIDVLSNNDKQLLLQIKNEEWKKSYEVSDRSVLKV